MKLVKVLFINFLIIIVLLFSFEIFLNFHYGKFESEKRYISLKEHVPYLEKNSKPSVENLKNIEQYNSFPNLENKEYRFRTDSDGFIIGEENIKIASDSVDIIFYGGSTTECLYVEESKRFPYLIQTRLNDSLDLKLNFLNAGVSGKNSLHSTFDFLAKGIPKRPKIVFLMHNINDLALLMKTGSYWDGPKTRSIVIQQEKSTSNLALILPNTSRLLKSILSPTPTDEWINYRDSSMDFSDEDILLEFKKSLINFIDIANNYNIKPVLMTQFNRLNSDDELILKYSKYKARDIDMNRLIDLYQKFNEGIRDVALHKNIGLIDLDSLVLPKTKYIYDEVHLNSEGSEFVADIITAYLVNNYYN